jgi:cell division initiation protein
MSDVTPHELRTVELREAWRGYRQDDVDEMLDRVAVTLEGLYEQIQALTDRVEKAESEVTSGADLEQMLRRTLMLAQQTADEAVSDAQKNAEHALSDAHATAAKLVADAQAEADALRDRERGRIEIEVNDLVDLRDQIARHVEELDRYERDYRAKLRQQLEADLQSLTERALIDRTEVPHAPDGVAPMPATAVEVDDDADVSVMDVVDASDASMARGTASSAWPGPARVTSPRDLDDETFFASLRDAVTDTSPLGPRDDLDPPLGVSGGREEPESSRLGSRFRRRS